MIIGNPPFLGAKRLKPERGADYVNSVRKAYPEVPGMADYCVYWFRRAHDHLPPCTPNDPVAGRAGLVGTQNVRNNQSRVGGLDYIVKTGTIVEAVDNQPWSGEANVHVSIANWVKHAPVGAVSDRDASVSRTAPSPEGPRYVSPGRSPGLGSTPVSPSPAGAMVGSQGRKPLVSRASTVEAPQGRKTKRGKRPATDLVMDDAMSEILDNILDESEPEADRPDLVEGRAPGQPPSPPDLLIPEKKRLWSKVPMQLDSFRSANGGKNIRTSAPGKRGLPRKDKTFELSYRDYGHINSSLSADTDVSGKRPLSCNKKPKRCFQGKIPGYDGFLVDSCIAERLRRDSSPVIVPYLTGRELLDEFAIDRWAIDFKNLDMAKAAAFASAFEHCRKHVLPAVRAAVQEAERDKSDMVSARKEHLDRWWQFWNRRDELNQALMRLRRYVACSRVTRRPVMVFLSSQICPSDLIQVFAFDDDYSFGVLQSSLHFEWFRKSSRLKVESDLRYSVREVFETFPWPQAPTVGAINSVAAASRRVRRARMEALDSAGGGLRAVYRLLELPGHHPLKQAHEELDTAVLDAYGFSSSGDPLSQLLDLNLDVAGILEDGGEVLGPGIPPSYVAPENLVSDDCLNP